MRLIALFGSTGGSGLCVRTHEHGDLFGLLRRIVFGGADYQHRRYFVALDDSANTADGEVDSFGYEGEGEKLWLL